MSKTLSKQVLLSVRALLSDSNRWTQFEQARSLAGTPCPLFNREAMSFCLVGAIKRLAYGFSENDGGRLAAGLIERLEQRLSLRGDRRDCAAYNDTVSHGQIIELVDEVLMAL